MIKFERVLCPVDLSTESDEALRYAVALGRAYGAKLILLIAESPALLLSGATGSRAARLFEQLLFRHMDADETKTPDWEPVVAEADGQLFGSTVDRVLRHASCPVLVSRPIKTPAESVRAA